MGDSLHSKLAQQLREIGNDTIDKLEEFQNTLFRCLLSVPKTTPKPALGAQD